MLATIGGEARFQAPSSRVRFFWHITPTDMIWSGLSAVLAFFIREGTPAHLDVVLLYAGMALVTSIVVFQLFGISASLPGFFSHRDAIAVTKASATAVALTAAALFVVTRLDDAPRSIPVIHFLLLVFGLVGIRSWNRLTDTEHAPRTAEPVHEEIECIIIVGATRLAWYYSRMLAELSARDRRIVAIVDERPHLIHRTLDGYRILGSPAEISRLIDEYRTHGVAITRIVVAIHPERLTLLAKSELGAIGQSRDISIEYLHDTLSVSQSSHVDAEPIPTAGMGLNGLAPSQRPYWKVKRALDIVSSLAMMITFAPLTLMVATLVLIDVGIPIVFWQRRIGCQGRPVHIYKFRTMGACFDRHGRLVPDRERLSVLGRVLRQSHLDELPQLFNILAGSMSLVGPRPLLPVDQPADVGLRLDVRPGLTGLAQISGGTLLSAEEKDAIDDWYVHHASLLLDIKIILRTLWIILRGNPRDDKQISTALAEQCVDTRGAFEPGR